MFIVVRDYFVISEITDYDQSLAINISLLRGDAITVNFITQLREYGGALVRKTRTVPITTCSLATGESAPGGNHD